MVLEGLYSIRKRVIDIGCGKGRLTWTIASRFGTVVAVDVNSRRVEALRTRLCQERVANVTVEEMDARQLAFPDCSFDLAIFGHSLDHIPEYPRALQEAHRILTADGEVYVALPDAGPATGAVAALEVLRRFEDDLLEWLRLGDGLCSVRSIPQEGLLAELRRAGFQDLRTTVTPAVPEEAAALLDGLIRRVGELLETARARDPSYRQEAMGCFQSLLAAARRQGVALRGTVEITGRI